MTDTITSQSHVRQGGRFLPLGVQRVLGDLRGRVDGDVLAVSYSEDGALQTMEEGGIFRRWDPTSGNLLHSLQLSEIETCWCFSRDGRWIASGSNGISIWDASSGEQLGRHEDPTWMTALAFSPDSMILASGHDDHKVRMWNSRTGKLLHVLSGHGDEISALAFSLDDRLATAAEDRTVAIWDVKTGDRIQKLEGHTDRVDDLAWSPKGHRLASAGWDTSVRVWNPDTGELLSMLNGQGECVHAVEFTSNGRWIVCADSDGFVRVWDYERLKIVGELHAHASATKRLAVRADGQQAVSAGCDRILQIFSIPKAEAVAEETGPRTAVIAIAPTTCDRLAVVHGEGTLSIWSESTGQCLGRGMADDVVLSVASASNGTLAVGTLGGTVAILTDPTRRPIRQWKAHESGTRLIAFRPDGRELATSMSIDGTVRVWDPATGEPTLIIPEATHGGSVEAIAYHPRESILAVAGIQWHPDGGADGAIVLWDTKEIRLVHSIPTGAATLAISPDGRYLAAVSLVDTILVWDLIAGELVREISSMEVATNALVFDPPSSLLVAAGDDGGLRTWDTKTWRMQASHDLDTRVRCLSFISGGRCLATGNGNSTCYLLDAASLM